MMIKRYLAFAGLAALLIASPVHNYTCVDRQVGKMISESFRRDKKYEIAGKTGRMMIDAFRGKLNDHRHSGGDFLSGVITNLDDYDLDKDGIIPVAEASGKKGMAILSPSKGIWIATDGSTSKLMGPKISLSGLAKAPSLEDYLVIPNDADDGLIYFSKHLTDNYDWLQSDSRCVKKTNGGYILRSASTDSYGFISRIIADAKIISSEGQLKFGRSLTGDLTHHQQAFKSISRAVKGEILLERILESSQVALFGEFHDGKNTDDYLVENMCLFAQNDYTFGLEFSHDEASRETGMRLKDLIDKFYRFEIGLDAITSFFDKKDLNDKSKIIASCRDYGIGIILLDDRDAAQRSYFKDPAHFELTRDYHMAANAMEFLLTNPGKKLAILVGRNHISTEPLIEVLGNMSYNPFTRHNEPVYTYPEPNPLAKRLKAIIGEDAATIALYDDFSCLDKIHSASRAEQDELLIRKIVSRMSFLAALAELHDGRSIGFDLHKYDVPYLSSEKHDYAIAITPLHMLR